MQRLKEWATDWRFDSQLVLWGFSLDRVRGIHEIFHQGQNQAGREVTTHVHVFAKMEGACALATRPPTRLHGTLHRRRYSFTFTLVIFFLNSHSGGWSPNWVHSARRPLNGLLYLPRVIVMVENLVE
jgi:hypothetical protein